MMMMRALYRLQRRCHDAAAARELLMLVTRARAVSLIIEHHTGRLPPAIAYLPAATRFFAATTATVAAMRVYTPPAATP